MLSTCRCCTFTWRSFQLCNNKSTTLKLVLTHARFQSCFIDFVCLCKTCEARTFQMFIKKTIKLLPIHQYRCDHFFGEREHSFSRKYLEMNLKNFPWLLSCFTLQSSLQKSLVWDARWTVLTGPGYVFEHLKNYN